MKFVLHTKQTKQYKLYIMKGKIILGIALSLFCSRMYSQAAPDYGSGLKVNLNEGGSKYFRLITWAQVQASYNNNVAEDQSKTNFNLRRARAILYAQLNEDFLILTHLGLNSLNANNLSPTGTGEASQFFLHDVIAQYRVAPTHYLGGGLHYYNGISRLNNQGTLNFLTMDNNRQSWATLGLSDQFARHLGFYAKGEFGKLHYRVSVNDAITNSLDARDAQEGQAVYGGRRLLGSKKAGKTYAGYFEYNFLDMESNFLPYKVGTYLGAKKVFNLGAGFFTHPSGAAILADNETKGEDVNIFAVDAFYDTPIGENGAAFTAYATYQHNDYGTNYLYNAYGTGSMTYAHVGYVIPGTIGKKTKLQPYAAAALNSYDAVKDNRNIFNIGTNIYLSGNNSKLTLEYSHEDFGTAKKDVITLQAMIYL